MPRKLNKVTCIDCGLAPPTVFLKPTGHVLKDGTGYCIKCYERAVRSSVDTGRSRDYMQVGTHPVITVF